jgi:hypothetical protein
MVCAPGYLSLVGETLWDMNMIESLLVASEYYFITCTIFSEVHLTTLRTEGISRNLYNSLLTDLITNTPRKNNHPPCLLITKYILILVRKTHYDIHMNVTKSDWFLHVLEHPIVGQEFTWMESFKLSFVHIGALCQLGFKSHWCYANAFIPSGKL